MRSVAPFVALFVLLVAGCTSAPPAPDDTGAGEPTATESASAIVPLDWTDPCAMLTEQELAAAVGIEGIGEITFTAEPGRCHYFFTDDADAQIGMDPRSGEEDLGVGVEDFSQKDPCFVDGGDCSTAEGYLAAWVSNWRDRLGSTAPGGHLDFGYGAEYVASSGVLAVSDTTGIRLQIFGCTSDQCRAAIIALLTALGERAP